MIPNNKQIGKKILGQRVIIIYIRTIVFIFVVVVITLPRSIPDEGQKVQQAKLCNNKHEDSGSSVGDVNNNILPVYIPM